MKFCKTCNQFADFYPKVSACKSCTKKRAVQWRLDNPARAISLRKGWKKVNADHVKASAKKYRQQPHRRETQRVHNLARIAREKGAEGFHTAADIRALMIAQAGLCAICAIDISSRYHVDHKIPLIKDGSNWPVNLQLLCPTCNCRKGSR